MMDNAPYYFILNHQPGELKPLLYFKHRTFNGTNTPYFIYFLQQYYQHHETLEEVFFQGMSPQWASAEKGLIYFQEHFLAWPMRLTTRANILLHPPVDLLASALICFCVGWFSKTIEGYTLAALHSQLSLFVLLTYMWGGWLEK